MEGGGGRKPGSNGGGKCTEVGIREGVMGSWWKVGFPRCRGDQGVNPGVKGVGSLQEMGEERVGRGIPKV